MSDLTNNTAISFITSEIIPPTLENQLQALQAEFEKIPEGYENAQEEVDHLSVETRNVFADYSHKLLTGEIDKGKYREQIAGFNLPEWLVDIVVDKSRISLQIRELQSQLLPAKLKAFQEEAEILLSSIDLDKVVLYYAKFDQSEIRKPDDLFINFVEYEYSLILKYLDKIKAGEIVSYEDYTFYERMFTQFSDLCWIYRVSQQISKSAGFISSAANMLERDTIIRPEIISGNVKIDGIKVRDGKILAVYESDIRNAFKSIPPVFLQNLKVIRRVNKPKNEEVESITYDPDIQIGDPIGEYIPEFDSAGKLESGRIEIYWPCDINADATQKEILATRDSFFLTLYHEIAHAIHFQLSFEEMKAWDEISLNGPDITKYVTESKKASMNKGKRESFADNFKFFMAFPVNSKHIFQRAITVLCCFPRFVGNR